MIETYDGALEWIGVGAVVALVGALIKFRGWTFLVAGINWFAQTAPRESTQWLQNDNCKSSTDVPVPIST